MSVDRKLKWIMVLLFLTWETVVLARPDVPILRANSNKLSVRDGKNYKKDVWFADKALKVDTYFADIPRKKHVVTFISDVDSISFKVSFGQSYDFIVVINDKDSCFTRISATYNSLSSYTHLTKKKTQGPDTIPFIMRNSRIYFEGSLNNCNGFFFQFDLGAGMSAVNHKSVSKTSIKFDSKTTLVNTDGANEAPVSNSVNIQIAGLNWKNISMVQTRNMDSVDDVIVGNSLFQDKVVEINYDKKIVIVHDTIPEIRGSYSRFDVIYTQHRPFIKACINLENHCYSDWFLFDTGRDGNMVLRDNFFRKNKVWDRLKSVFVLGNKHIVVIPELQVGEKIFTDVISPAYNPAKMNTDRPNILGNKILNHFNVILDNQNGFIYLMTNNLPNKTYESYASFKLDAGMLLFGAISVIFIVVISFRKLKSHNISKP